jgi:hypothetical protein
MLGDEESHAPDPGCQDFRATIAIKIRKCNAHALPGLFEPGVAGPDKLRLRRSVTAGGCRIGGAMLIQKDRHALTTAGFSGGLWPRVSIRE